MSFSEVEFAQEFAAKSSNRVYHNRKNVVAPMLSRIKYNIDRLPRWSGLTLRPPYTGRGNWNKEMSKRLSADEITTWISKAANEAADMVKPRPAVKVELVDISDDLDDPDFVADYLCTVDFQGEDDATHMKTLAAFGACKIFESWFDFHTDYHGCIIDGKSEDFNFNISGVDICRSKEEYKELEQQWEYTPG